MIVTKDLLFGYYYGWGALLVALLVLAFIMFIIDRYTISVGLVIIMVIIVCFGCGNDKDLPLSTIDKVIKVETIKL